jgi:hypothetical protein
VRKADKVAIIAAGPTWRESPFGNPAFEVWGLNAFHRIHNHRFFTRWFQIHQPGSGEGHIDDPDHIMWLKEAHSFPIYTVRKLDEYPSSVPYPYDEVVKKFCPSTGPYFTNSVDYMVTMAMLEGFPEIYVYGTDFISDGDDDYFKRRQSLEYYCGRADGMGLKVIVPDDCALLRAEDVYGFHKKRHDNDDTIKNLAKLRDKITDGRKAAVSKFAHAKTECDRADGSLEMINEIIFHLRMRKRGLPY